ncbi:response regulator [Candidatus Woesearchaeota archaeon]|nr:response regulator [Candidatus Woesearchaeota archaeon]
MKNYYNKFEDLELKINKNLVLIIEDEESYRNNYSNLAKQEGYNVISCDNSKEGIEKALELRPGIVITDKDLSGKNGSEVAEEIKKHYTPRIAGITGGNPDDFNNYVDIKASKNITNEQYLNILKNLSYDNSDEDFENVTKLVPSINKLAEEYEQNLFALKIIYDGARFADTEEKKKKIMSNCSQDIFNGKYEEVQNNLKFALDVINDDQKISALKEFIEFEEQNNIFDRLNNGDLSVIDEKIEEEFVKFFKNYRKICLGWN